MGLVLDIVKSLLFKAMHFFHLFPKLSASLMIFCLHRALHYTILLLKYYCCSMIVVKFQKAQSAKKIQCKRLCPTINIDVSSTSYSHYMFIISQYTYCY
jgi:hypothetical protein